MTDSVFRGVACPSSYWVGADRATLAARIAERRAQQAIPTSADAAFDPALSATAALADMKTRARLARARQKRRGRA